MSLSLEMFWYEMFFFPILMWKPTTTTTPTTTPTPTTTTTSSTPVSTSSSGLSSAAIGGIAGGIVGGFVLFGAAIAFVLYRRKAKDNVLPPQVSQIDYDGYAGKPEDNYNAPSHPIRYPEEEAVSGRLGSQI